LLFQRAEELEADDDEKKQYFPVVLYPAAMKGSFSFSVTDAANRTVLSMTHSLMESVVGAEMPWGYHLQAGTGFARPKRSLPPPLGAGDFPPENFGAKPFEFGSDIPVSYPDGGALGGGAAGASVGGGGFVTQPPVDTQLLQTMSADFLYGVQNFTVRPQEWVYPLKMTFHNAQDLRYGFDAPEARIFVGFYNSQWVDGAGLVLVGAGASVLAPLALFLVAMLCMAQRGRTNVFQG
jgi:hypothetical protein